MIMPVIGNVRCVLLDHNELAHLLKAWVRNYMRLERHLVTVYITWKKTRERRERERGEITNRGWCVRIVHRLGAHSSMC